MKPDHRQLKRALSSEYVELRQTSRGVSRQYIVLALAVVTILFGGEALERFRGDREATLWIAGVIGVLGATAGALYHPVWRFWWRGAVAGFVVTAGAFGAHHAYTRFRPEPWGHEFAIVFALGALPGIVVYYALMRHQVVLSPTGEPGAAEQGDAPDEAGLRMEPRR